MRGIKMSDDINSANRPDLEGILEGSKKKLTFKENVCKFLKWLFTMR